MSYKVLFLDLDNTILDFNKAEENAIKRVLKKYDLPCDKEACEVYSRINRSFWERFEKKEIKREEIFEGRFKTLLSCFNEERNTKAIADDYCRFLSEGYFTVDGAIDILSYLKNRGYYLCATTNGAASTQYSRIENSGTKPFFDEIFVSEETGFQKPERQYFDFVLKNIPEKDRSQVLIIGDSQSSDILGGINSGIDTCWFNPDGLKPKYKSKFEIKALEELRNIL